MEVILQNLTKKFPGRDRRKKKDVIAVSDFSFRIPDGKLIGLLGPSGCGKSTTPVSYTGAFRMRKKHDSESDQRSGEAHCRKNLLRGG